METTLIYFSVKALSATYILYKVWMFIFSPRVYNFGIVSFVICVLHVSGYGNHAKSGWRKKSKESPV